MTTLTNKNMLKNRRVILFFGIVVMAAIIIVIFVAMRSGRTKVSDTSDAYNRSIVELSDTIKELQGNIAKYEEAIENLENANKGIKKEIIQLIKDNEKTDSKLANGDWDYNIKYLTEYLSKKDSLGK